MASLNSRAESDVTVLAVGKNKHSVQSFTPPIWLNDSENRPNRGEPPVAVLGSAVQLNRNVEEILPFKANQTDNIFF